MKISIDHCAIRVADFERSIDFYKRYFGFEQYGSFEGPPAGKEVHLRSGTAHLELFPLVKNAGEPDLGSIGKNDRGFCHMALNVDQIEELYNRMKKDGVPITVELCDETLDNGDKNTCFFFKDPDDTIVEVIKWYH